jgi:tetratricopeptide (TPR) repeat protein
MKRVFNIIGFSVFFIMSSTAFAMQLNIKKIQPQQDEASCVVTFNQAYMLYEGALRDECFDVAAVFRKYSKINEAIPLLLQVLTYESKERHFGEMRWHAMFLLARCYFLCQARENAIDLLQKMIHDLFRRNGYEYWYIQAVNLYGELLLLDKRYSGAESAYGKLYKKTSGVDKGVSIAYYRTVDSIYEEPINQESIKENLCGLAVSLWGQKRQNTLSIYLLQKISQERLVESLLFRALKLLESSAERFEREACLILDLILSDELSGKIVSDDIKNLAATLSSNATAYKNLYQDYLSCFFEW